MFPRTPVGGNRNRERSLSGCSSCVATDAVGCSVVSDEWNLAALLRDSPSGARWQHVCSSGSCKLAAIFYEGRLYGQIQHFSLSFFVRPCCEKGFNLPLGVWVAFGLVLLEPAVKAGELIISIVSKGFYWQKQTNIFMSCCPSVLCVQSGQRLTSTRNSVIPAPVYLCTVLYMLRGRRRGRRRGWKHTNQENEINSINWSYGLWVCPSSPPFTCSAASHSADKLPWDLTSFLPFTDILQFFFVALCQMLTAAS